MPFTYDAASRLVTAVSGRYQNTVSRQYDLKGRLLREDQALSGQPTRSVWSAYDAADRRTAITHPDGRVQQRAYDPRSLLQQVAWLPAGALPTTTAEMLAQRGYDAAGRLTSHVSGNGVAETRTYRNDGLVERIRASQPASIIGATVGDITDLTYAYDAAGRKTGVASPRSEWAEGFA